MENIQTFQTISQRVLFALKLAFSDFSPVKSETVSEDAQKELHTLMHDIQEKLYDAPQLLSLTMDADDSYPWYLCNNQRPELNAVYTTVFKTLYQFYLFLLAVSKNGTLSNCGISIKKQQLKNEKSGYKTMYGPILHAVGIDVLVTKDSVTLSHPNGQTLFAAMKLLGSNCSRTFFDIPEGWRDSASLQRNLFFFAACCYSCNVEYLLHHIDELYGMDGLLLRLKEDCMKSGYTYNVRTGLSQTDITISIEMKNGVGGFLIVYNPRKTQKVGFGTLNGIGEKAILDNFNNLDNEMKAYFISICRPCHDCFGCTKGGKNKPFTVNVHYNDQDYRLCPMFPNHSWEMIDDALIHRLMKYHELQNIYAKQQ